MAKVLQQQHFGQCGGYRIPATLKDGTSGKSYTVGYLKPVECMIDLDIGVKMLFAGDKRLILAHHEIMAQGKMIEESRQVVGKSDEHLARFTELKAATGCRGVSVPISILLYTDATTFVVYPEAHCMALGLHSQFMKQMRDVLGEDAFYNSCKRANKRVVYILRPSILKLPVKRMLPESIRNLLSGYEVEYHQHSMECYHVLVFRRSFHFGPERNMLKCSPDTVDKVYKYWRFFADNTSVTKEDPQAKVANVNDLITHCRKNFEADVTVYVSCRML
jgi:hypothetical protein